MDYKLKLLNGSAAYLAHHGVKGMHWGVWNEETRARYADKGGVMAKGTNISRVANSLEDPTYDNKKYVSTNKADHKKWEKYLGEGYRARGQDTYNIMYQTTKDLKIASNKEAGRIFVEQVLSKQDRQQVAMDTYNAYAKLGQKLPENPSAEEMASYNLAMQTKTGKAYVDALLKSGYSGVADVHGQNTSKDPLIIFEPEKNLKRIGAEKTKY